jgi:hypothetical protein
MLRTLAEHGVDFIVVGGVCAALHGSPLSTVDLDIVHARSEDNLDRLESALRDMGAVYRVQPERQLVPPRSALSGTGHQLLICSNGSLDLLGSIDPGWDFDALLEHALELDLGEGLRVRVLDLPTLIQSKQVLGRPKDQLAILHLNEILAESRPD